MIYIVPVGGSAMDSIGDSLRQAREEKGLSLSDVQRITKIRSHYLEALEAGEFAILPGQAYERAFIRTYASAIGIDPQPYLARYDNLRAEAERELQAQQAGPPPSKSWLVARRILATLNGTMEWLGL